MFRVSERFACRVVGQHRSTQRHATKVVDIEEAKLRRRLREIAAEHIRWGRRMAYRLLRREGWLDAAYGSEEIDQRDLLFQQVGRLERIARKAENAGQFSAAVGAITALNRMMALGADQKGFRGHSNHHYRR